MIETLSGNDTITLFDRVLNNLANADTAVLTYPDSLVATTTGKNGNTIFSKNEKGNNGTLVLRVMRGSSDDKFLQAKLALLDKDISSFTLAEGEITKRLGDGNGNVTRDVYSLSGGIFSKKVEAKENVEGDTEQSVSTYNFFFANVKRSMM